jgi:hypothetical protein
VPKEKSDFRLVADKAVEGGQPAALRLSKTVRGGDESTYILLLPGVVPDPLKLSIHPSGDVHLQSREAGLITRLDKDTLMQSLLSGSLDDTLARFLTPQLDHEAAEGFVLGPDLLALGLGGADRPLADVNLSIGQLVDGLTKIRIEDMTEVRDAIARLREDGLLPERTLLQLVTERSEKPIAFLNLMGRPLGERPVSVPVPEGFPFPKSFRALLDSLARYGGVLFTLPSEDEIAEMAKVVGLGELLAGLNRFAEVLNTPRVEENVGRVLGEIVEGAEVPLRQVARSKPVRPLRTPRRKGTIRAPPPGG